MTSPVARWIGGLGLAIVNVALGALFVWLAYHPFSYFGHKDGRVDYFSLVLLGYPAINLVALSVAWRSPGAQLVSSVYYLNVAFALLAALGGIGSCVESIYSGLEKVMTLVTFTPPLVSALGLRQLRNG